MKNRRNSNVLTKSTGKQNRNTTNTTNTPNKTTSKKIKHSQFRLFQQLPAPKILVFQNPSQQVVTKKQKLNRALELIFKLLDSKRKGFLSNTNINANQLHPSIVSLLSPILFHVLQLQDDEQFSLHKFKQEVIQSEISQQLYEYIFWVQK